MVYFILKKAGYREQIQECLGLLYRFTCPIIYLQPGNPSLFCRRGFQLTCSVRGLKYFFPPGVSVLQKYFIKGFKYLFQLYKICSVRGLRCFFPSVLKNFQRVTYFFPPGLSVRQNILFQRNKAFLPTMRIRPTKILFERVLVFLSSRIICPT